ncbi:helix-turn-helix domain-containing protein [Arhodomonas aquaeolei]|uniref:helix-turn-helix domain-containing protein n=1 Tax=Arhodomonas aquaeolei TaxID=2369 RepID=UPI002167E68F|nr:helix-turn-helix domain-containing protein [Arhodomonas aquaeolei]MCS4503857.1 helix-turn-helix domain-containing protein [Arhodomonas aquaeolei]
MTRQTSKPASVRVSTWNSDAFSDRLKQAMGKRTAYSIEQETGIAQSLVRKYLSGASTPGTDKLVALAAATGVSVEWLATGREPVRAVGQAAATSSEVDLERLEEVIAKTRAKFKERNINLTPQAEARVICLIYDFYVRQGAPMDAASLENVIELAAFR